MPSPCERARSQPTTCGVGAPRPQRQVVDFRLHRQRALYIRLDETRAGAHAKREAAKRGRGLAKSPFRQAQGPEQSRKGSQSHEPNRFHRRERRDRRETTASHSSFTCGVKMGARSNAFQSSAFVLFAFLAVIEMPKSGSSARLRELRGLRVLHLAHASGYTDSQSEIANRK